MTDDQIRENLVGQGWGEKDVMSVLTPNMATATQNTILKKTFIILIPVLWIIALFLPAYIFPPSAYDSKQATYFGYDCLLWGWAGGGIAFIAWISNLPWLISYILLASKKSARKKSIVFAGIAFALSLSALTTTELLRDEAGHTGQVNASIGAYVWILSMLTLLIGNIILYKIKSN